ncbi:MAG: formamidopyrimidine-DNA glycosylase [Bacteroidota bacterium]|nr:formamidopyrimidine-DNA glycosylase [Bacteroidota bacterium]
MPELPEVTTTVLGLQKEAVGWSISSVWTDLAVAKPSRSDFYDTIKYDVFYKNFVKIVSGQKIIDAERRAKNILIHLQNGYTILIHLKMTGHLMIGQYEYSNKENKWHVHDDEKNHALRDSYNKYIHFVFELSKNNKTRHLVFCDARKFGKITLIKNSELESSKHLAGAGPEPIHSHTNKNILRDISFSEFEIALDKRSSNNSKTPIKTFLMDTKTIAGIGNIYSDELLFRAGVHPKSLWVKIPKDIRKKIYTAMISVLKKGIDFGGDSTSDYRNIYGQPGKFHENHMAYKNKGLKCLQKNCGGEIVREVINGRSAHFCNIHQKLYN